jgi:hypothetical protein
MLSSSSPSIWKTHFLTNKALDISNKHLDKIRSSSMHSIKFQKSFDEFQKMTVLPSSSWTPLKLIFNYFTTAKYSKEVGPLLQNI